MDCYYYQRKIPICKGKNVISAEKYKICRKKFPSYMEKAPQKKCLLSNIPIKLKHRSYLTCCDHRGKLIQLGKQSRQRRHRVLLLV